MSGRRHDGDLGLGQVAIGVLYCCALAASIAVVTFIIIRVDRCQFCGGAN